MTKRVAVIGSGCSGLAAIKCCLDEGLEPVCFERSDAMGGLWNYTKESDKGGLVKGSVMKSTSINTSKEMMSFSDYPIPRECPQFMHNRQVYEYFNSYADQFGLKDYISYNTETVLIKPARDYDATGKWSITTRDLKTDKDNTDTFDGVMVCTGHHAYPNMPSFNGLDKFKGTKMHTHALKEPSQFLDKRVVVIGVGNSGVDAATDISKVSRQVYLSTRRGFWLFSRFGPNGLAGDMFFNTRYISWLVNLLPRFIVASILQNSVNDKFDHDIYGIRPECDCFSTHVTANDELPNKIISGSVKIKPNVRKFTEAAVEFEDGTVADIDAVILATGYVFGFPFIDKSVIDVQNNEVNLYKYMYPPDLKHSTLAIIGCFQPLGALMPIVELQCRWATRNIKGATKLPSTQVMWKDIRKKKAALAARYVKTTRHTMQVDFVPFMVEIADQVGCNPQFWKMWLTDPWLAYTCYYGPLTAYQFRLHGPGQWKGARKAIQGQWDRVLYSTKTRTVPKKKFDAWPAIKKFLRLLYYAILLMVVYYVVCHKRLICFN